MKDSLWFIFIGNSLILRKEGHTVQIPVQNDPPLQIQPWTHVQNLPDYDGHTCRAYKVEQILDGGLPDGYSTMELRSTYNVLPYPLFLIAGKAAELLYWDSNTKYCGHCGAPMQRTSDISKSCTNCGKEVWPSVAPAIIVRIRRAAIIDNDGRVIEQEKILLVHARNFRHADRYGLVAGFVETGETLEQCVEREVREETSLKIKNLQYFGSQPWPFPSGIMIGFTADYDSGEIHLQNEELSRGGWFGVDNMPDIPDRMSIARQLIDDWMRTIKKA